MLRYKKDIQQNEMHERMTIRDLCWVYPVQHLFSWSLFFCFSQSHSPTLRLTHSTFYSMHLFHSSSFIKTSPFSLSSRYRGLKVGSDDIMFEIAPLIAHSFPPQWLNQHTLLNHILELMARARSISVCPQ